MGRVPAKTASIKIKLQVYVNHAISRNVNFVIYKNQSSFVVRARPILYLMSLDNVDVPRTVLSVMLIMVAAWSVKALITLSLMGNVRNVILTASLVKTTPRNALLVVRILK